MILSELKTLAASCNSFLLSTHIGPDGDSIGSQLSLYWYFESLGKDAVIYNADPVPGKFQFLHNADKITDQRPNRAFDALIVLDCSNTERLGWNGSKDIAHRIVNIDHHRDNAMFGTVNFIDGAAAATGQVLYHFFDDHGVQYPAYVAEALYTAIMTDTGGFRFSNTSAEILKICADLAQKGADCARVSKQVYGSLSTGGLILQSLIWSTLKFHCNGRICSMEMPYSLIDQTGASYGDSEGMAEYTTIAKGVDVGVLMKYRDNETHFSLRSTGAVDVGKLARGVRGGGGHINAAGCTLYLPKEKAFPIMLETIRKELP
jgi:phosphoesterase RecJ-like protein